MCVYLHCIGTIRSLRWYHLRAVELLQIRLHRFGLVDAVFLSYYQLMSGTCHDHHEYGHIYK